MTLTPAPLPLRERGLSNRGAGGFSDPCRSCFETINAVKKQLTAENAGIAEKNQELVLETGPTKKLKSFAGMSFRYSLCSEPVPE
jgi:hypothetical protein